MTQDDTPNPDRPPIPSGHSGGFRDLVGYETIVWREGYGEIALELGDAHKNRMGIVHGGVYMTILDAAMGHAATWCADKSKRRRCVTVSMTTGFLSSVTDGRIIAYGHLVGVENRMATCLGEIRDVTGNLLLTAQGTFRYLPDRR